MENICSQMDVFMSVAVCFKQLRQLQLQRVGYNTNKLFQNYLWTLYLSRLCDVYFSLP